MKGAAKCDKHCELQNSVNQQVLERILRFRDIPESMPASVSTHFHSHTYVSFCAPRRTRARDVSSVIASARDGYGLSLVFVISTEACVLSVV